jgi:hypothetical protein
VAGTAPDESAPALEVGEGVWLRTAEEIFPIAWLTMVAAVACIALYFAVAG